MPDLGAGADEGVCTLGGGGGGGPSRISFSRFCGKRDVDVPRRPGGLPYFGFFEGGEEFDGV